MASGTYEHVATYELLFGAIQQITRDEMSRRITRQQAIQFLGGVAYVIREAYFGEQRLLTDLEFADLGNRIREWIDG